jgi:hypothetical protein
LKRSIGDVMNKKIADDRLSQWREHRHTKIQIVGDLDEYTGGSFLEGPDDQHAFGQSLKVTHRIFRSIICSDIHEIGMPERFAAR